MCELPPADQLSRPHTQNPAHHARTAFAFSAFPDFYMIDQQKFEQLVPLAYQWAKQQEDFVLAHGFPLTARLLDDARLAGVRDCSKIRVLIVDRIPLPDDPELAAATRNAGVITNETRCMGFGHAIIIRDDCWGDRELLLHNLIHIAQCEECGGLEPWIYRYLGDRRNCAKFTLGSLEEEARGRAREMCARS